MFRRVLIVLSAPALLLIATMVQAADIARLEWGGFVIEADSSGGTQDWTATASDDGRSVTMTFNAFEAKADGTVLEGKSNIAGYFNVSQPGSEAFTSLHVEISGYVIKSKTAATRIAVKLGPSEQTLEWPADASVSEKFTRSFDIAIASAGRLPNPFPVSAEVSVHKDNVADSAFVSVNQIRITAAHPAVASAN